MVQLLEFILAAVASSGIPVFLANFLKYVFPSMDGQTDKVVNVMVAVLFAGALIWGQFGNLQIIYDILPGISVKIHDFLQIIIIFAGLFGAKNLAPQIYGLVRNRIPVLGKSFNKSTKRATFKLTNK